MNAIFEKLQLKGQKRILVLNIPDHFQNAVQEELSDGVIVDDERMPSAQYDFAITFVSNVDEMGAEAYMISKSLVRGPFVFWVAFEPSSGIDMDEAREIMQSMNMDQADEIELDDQWRAMRFVKS